ncbi:MAG TPA: hypothetical protein GX704_03565 [Clostridiales bacterium]|jgi:hypothetical protein|nr:hypothetical protein [Clostridiales bacterium]
MNEVGYRVWSAQNGKNKKVVSDNVSRLKRLERELGQINIDDEYKKDQCHQLLSLFDNTGKNPEMKKYNSSLPIGKYYLSTYKHALRTYIEYLKSI